MTKPADHSAKPAAPSPGRLPPLRDRRQCARYVATLIRGAHRGEIPLDRARTITYMVQTLAGLLGDVDLDDRLAAIEAQVATMGDR